MNLIFESKQPHANIFQKGQRDGEREEQESRRESHSHMQLCLFLFVAHPHHSPQSPPAAPFFFHTFASGVTQSLCFYVRFFFSIFISFIWWLLHSPKLLVSLGRSWIDIGKIESGRIWGSSSVPLDIFVKWFLLKVFWASPSPWENWIFHEMNILLGLGEALFKSSTTLKAKLE